MKEKSFLGIGWGFPPNFRKDSGDITMVSDEEDIRQSLIEGHKFTSLVSPKLLDDMLIIFS